MFGFNLSAVREFIQLRVVATGNALDIPPGDFLSATGIQWLLKCVITPYGWMERRTTR